MNAKINIEVCEEYRKLMEDLAIRLNYFIKANFLAFTGLIGKENIASENFDKEFKLE